MTLLDRFRPQPGYKHPDPTIRLASVVEIPLNDRDLISAVAREDEDPRVRRAAVAKLMDPTGLGAIARDDNDESVRAAAMAMLRDIALEAFEGIGEAESLEAVDALPDDRPLVQIAKESGREIVALRALSRLNESRRLGSIARHGACVPARRMALDRLQARDEHAELLAIAMNGEFKDTAVAAVDLITDRGELEQIASRSKNKIAAKRARTIVREADECAALEAAAADRAADRGASSDESGPPLAEAVAASSSQGDTGAVDTGRSEGPVLPPVDEEAVKRREEHEAAERVRRQAEVDAQVLEESARRQARLAELAEAAAADHDLASAHRSLDEVRREWNERASGISVDPALAARFADARSRLQIREAEAQEANARTRREALARLQQRLARLDELLAKPEVSLKTAERTVRDLRTVLAAVLPLPTRHDRDDIARRLKAAQVAWTSKLQDLREADDWRRWANVAVQERLCAKMEALRSLEDPEVIAREVRELQQQWRLAADVPRAQAETLWRRFKAAHDEAWTRCEAYFAEQERARAENLTRKIALCEKAESLADSTQWIQTADEIKKLQAEWKTIGPVPRGGERSTWERFRSACDRFFSRRHEDLARRKAMWAEAFARKEALCVRAEALAESTDWEVAAAELRRLQAEWKTIGPVKKSRSEAIWQRFRGSCDRFFVRYSQRHEAARAEQVAAREAICAELESLGAVSRASDTEAPADLLASVQALRGRWQQEIAARGVDPDRARALDDRFEEAFASVIAAWPSVFGGTDLDPDANRNRMESMARQVEELARSLGGPAAAVPGASLSPTTRLASMLKEALAANTIGGKVDEDSRVRAAAEEVRHDQAAWSRIGPVPEATRRALTDRFQRACRRVLERQGEQKEGRKTDQQERIVRRG